MEIYVNRLLRERGTIMGTLKVVKEVEIGRAHV